MTNGLVNQDRDGLWVGGHFDRLDESPRSMSMRWEHPDDHIFPFKSGDDRNPVSIAAAN